MSTQKETGTGSSSRDAIRGETYRAAMIEGDQETDALIVEDVTSPLYAIERAVAYATSRNFSNITSITVTKLL